MTKEVLKQALEAFGEIEWSNNSQWQSDRAKVAIATLKEALANEALEKMAENARELGLDYEPAQKPVAWAKFSAKGNIIDLLNEPDDGYTPLYATSLQRTWVNATTWRGLTDEELGKVEVSAADFENGFVDLRLICRAIEAKLKEKNNG